MVLNIVLTEFEFDSDEKTADGNNKKIGGLMNPAFKDVLRLKPESAKLCSLCDKPGSMWCGGCSVASYCSVECQRKNWPLHKKFCKGFKTSRPSPDHRRVIYFPIDADKPVLIWAKYENLHREQLQVDEADLEQLLKILDLGKSPKNSQVALPATRELVTRKIGYGLINVSFCQVAENKKWDPLLLNKSIASLATPGFIFPFMGPIISYAAVIKPADSDNIKVLDVSMRDVCSVVEFFCNNHLNSALGNAETACVPRIHACMLFDKGNPYNKAAGVSNPISAVITPIDHKLSLWDPCHWAAVLGLSWYIRDQYGPSFTPAAHKRLKDGFQKLGRNHSDSKMPTNERGWTNLDIRWLRFYWQFREYKVASRTQADGDDGQEDELADTLVELDLDERDTAHAETHNTEAIVTIKSIDGAETTETVQATVTIETSVTIKDKAAEDVETYSVLGLHSCNPTAGFAVANAWGLPIHPHQILALNEYLDLSAVTRSIPTQQGFKKFWDKYHARLVKRELEALAAQKKPVPASDSLDLVANKIPNPYVWEERKEKEWPPVIVKEMYQEEEIEYHAFLSSKPGLFDGEYLRKLMTEPVSSFPKFQRVPTRKEYKKEILGAEKDKI